MSDEEDFGPRPPAAAAAPRQTADDEDSESEMGPPRPPAAAAAASAEKKKGPSKPSATGAESAEEAPSSGSRGGRGPSDRAIYQRVPRTGSLKLKGSVDKKKKREMMRAAAVVPAAEGGGGEDEVRRLPDGKRNWIEYYPEKADYKADIEAEKAKARELRRMNVVGGPSTAKAKDWAHDYMMRGGAADQQRGSASARLNERIKKKTDKFCK